MARRDYKSRASRAKAKKPVSPWVWLLIGFISGASLIGFLCLKYSPAPATSNWIGAKPPVRSETRKTAAPAQAKVKPPRFDFYNLLPDQEVLVPDEEIERQVKKAPPVKPQQKPGTSPGVKPTNGKRYLVQVSSFRNHKEAQALKAKLAFLGLHAKVNKAVIKGSSWYRVQLGPFGDAAQMQDIRKQLASSGYNSLAIALK
jgi:cell division protein FtsN